MRFDDQTRLLNEVPENMFGKRNSSWRIRFNHIQTPKLIY